MEAIRAAARQILDQCCEDLRITVNGLDSDLLAREPAADTSSIATLIRHATSATRFMLSCAATGHGPRTHYRSNVRPAAFTNQPAVADDLIALIDAIEEEGRRLIADIPLDRLDERVEMDDDAEEEPPTRAWMLLHALEHMREHVGHAQLTRQVLTG